MPKLAIYVPKQEMREIEKWRKRINFSRVFMRALRAEIRERPRRLETHEDQLTAAARHYKHALTDKAGSLADFGFRLGGEDVLQCRLDAETIHRLVEIDDPDKLSPADVQAIEIAMQPRMQAVHEFARKHGYQQPWEPSLQQAVFRGYVQGVAEAWKKVCQRMASLDS